MDTEDVLKRLEALEEAAKFSERLRYEQAAVVATLAKPAEGNQTEAFNAFAQGDVQDSVLSAEHQHQLANLVNRMSPDSSIWVSYWKDHSLVVVVHNGTAGDLRQVADLLEHSICAQAASVAVWSGDKVNTMNAFLNAAFRNEDAQACCSIFGGMVFYSNCPWRPCTFLEQSRHQIHAHRGRLQMRPFGELVPVRDITTSPPLFTSNWYDFRSFMDVAFLGQATVE